VTEQEYKQYIRDMQESWSEVFGKLVKAISAQRDQIEQLTQEVRALREELLEEKQPSLFDVDKRGL
jgi:hypothetical protein